RLLRRGPSAASTDHGRATPQAGRRTPRLHVDPQCSDYRGIGEDVPEPLRQDQDVTAYAGPTRCLDRPAMQGVGHLLGQAGNTDSARRAVPPLYRADPPRARPGEEET